MKRVKCVTLLVTRRCNLRCSYCYVREYQGGEMALETARQIVQNVMREASEGYDLVEFTFLGGEPFCAFPVVKALSEWMWAQEWPRPYLLTAATNGTLIRGEVKQWLEENHHRFYPTLSYDGGDSQNASRSGSGSQIDLAYFRKNWPGLPVKMTISEKNVSHLAQDMIALWEQGIGVNDTFAGGEPAWSEASLEELGKQLDRLCTYSLTHEVPRQSGLLTMDLRRALWKEESGVFQCGAGKERVTYDYDGKQYLCHLLSPLVLDGKQMAALAQACTPEPEKACLTCPLNGVCPTCDGNSFRLYGCLGKRDTGLCEVVKCQVYYACRYQTKGILAKKERSREDMQTLAAVQKLLEDPAWLPAPIRKAGIAGI